MVVAVVTSFIGFSSWCSLHVVCCRSDPGVLSVLAQVFYPKVNYSFFSTAIAGTITTVLEVLALQLYTLHDVRYVIDLQLLMHVIGIGTAKGSGLR